MDEYNVDARGNIWGVESPALLEKMPKGIMGNNGRVDTPNYKLVDGVPVERTEEDKNLDPSSDPPEASEADKLRADVEMLTECLLEVAGIIYE